MSMYDSFNRMMKKSFASDATANITETYKAVGSHMTCVEKEE